MQWAESDVITTDKYLAAFPQNYYKMDLIHYGRVMEWRGRVYRPPTALSRFIVSGHSDFSITDGLVRNYPLAKWFGVNNQSRRACGIPLGITNNTNETDVHSIYGNVDVMVELASKPREIKNLVYMNFATNTYPMEREKVWNMFRTKEWVTAGIPVNTMEGRKMFLTEMRDHEYILCPRGNGIDTHRLWETLYMGSIPIVIQDVAHAGWQDLPILFVSSWEEVTEDFLRKQLPRFQTTQWNMKKLHVGYWINHIRETYNENRNGSRRN
jgi:hypothetical protein